MISYSHPKSISPLSVAEKLKKEGSFTCILPYSNREYESFITNSLRIVFEQLKIPQLGNTLPYCLKELIMNGSKANSKRVYFKSKGLDINNMEDYTKGMKTFRNDVFGNFSQYADQHKEWGYYVHTEFILKDKLLRIRITNNSRICQDEEQRIAIRLKNAAKFENMEQALAHGFDSTEGAGFGIILVVLTLRKIGLDERAFHVVKGDNTTTCILDIPLNLVNKDQGVIIAEQISKEIESIPPFPESISQLYANLSNPNCDFNSVTNIIKRDTTLTTEIIRIANSAIYMLPQKVDNVTSAVRMIGLKGIKNFVLSYGVNTVFQNKYKREKIKEVMDHSYQVAINSCCILKAKGLLTLRDDVYVAALLHDFGKIVVESLKPQMFAKIKQLCNEKGIPISSIEDLTQGYNHSIVGSLLAQKWNFPQKFVKCIKYHHIPLESGDSYKGLIYSVYLGNELYYYMAGEREFGDINNRVLQFFGLSQEQSLKKIVEMITAYE